jgi:voltage-gated potassium channel Kch
MGLVSLLVYHSIILSVFTLIYASIISSPEHIEITSANTERSRITALYMAVSTHTTVGYGDIVPASTRARLLTSLHMLLVFLATIGALAN